MDVDFEAGEVPAEALGDRLWRALKHVNMGKGQMAEHLGVDRNTVSRYINDKVTPSRSVLRLWALRCGVPYTWLATGELPTDSGSVTRHERTCAGSTLATISRIHPDGPHTGQTLPSVAQALAA